METNTVRMVLKRDDINPDNHFGFQIVTAYPYLDIGREWDDSRMCDLPGASVIPSAFDGFDLSKEIHKTTAFQHASAIKKAYLDHAADPDAACGARLGYDKLTGNEMLTLFAKTKDPHVQYDVFVKVNPSGQVDAKIQRYEKDLNARVWRHAAMKFPGMHASDQWGSSLLRNENMHVWFQKHFPKTCMEAENACATYAGYLGAEISGVKDISWNRIKPAEPDKTHGKSAANLARMLGAIDDFYPAKDKLTAAFIKAAMKEQGQNGKITGVDRILVKSGYRHDSLLVSVHGKDGNNIDIPMPMDNMEKFGISEDDINRLSDRDSQARMRETVQTFAGHMADAERSGMTLSKCTALMREGAKVNDLVSYLTPSLTIPREHSVLDYDDDYMDALKEKQEDLWKIPDLAAHRDRCERLAAVFVPLAEQAIDGKNWAHDMARIIPRDAIPGRDVQAHMNLRPALVTSELLENYGLKEPADHNLRAHLDEYTSLAERTDGIPGVRDISWNKDTFDVALCDPKTPGQTASILSVPAGTLEGKGIEPARLMGLAERYSGPLVDVYLTKDAEDRVRDGKSMDLRTAGMALWDDAGAGQYDVADRGRAAACCALADCHSVDECKDVAKELNLDFDRDKGIDLSEERDGHAHMKEGEEY